MEWLAVLLIGLVLSFAIALWAEAWGRTSWVYFLLSLLLTPLNGALALLVAGRRIPRPQSGGRANPRTKYCTKCGAPSVCLRWAPTSILSPQRNPRT